MSIKWLGDLKDSITLPGSDTLRLSEFLVVGQEKKEGLKPENQKAKTEL